MMLFEGGKKKKEKKKIEENVLEHPTSEQENRAKVCSARETRKQDLEMYGRTAKQFPSTAS